VNLWNYQSKAAERDTIRLKCFEDPKDYVYDVDWCAPAFYCCNTPGLSAADSTLTGVQSTRHCSAVWMGKASCPCTT
jgi:hypothetical protein